MKELVNRPELAFIAQLAPALPEAEWFVVGGAVRDSLLGRPIKDIDLLVRKVPAEKLVAALSKIGSVIEVGRQFGVFVFTPTGSSTQFDIALPRAEQPGMSGAYRDVVISADPTFSLEVDLARRDFTINAMAVRVSDGELLDFHDGKKDLESKILRTVGDSSRRFAEDITRVLRGLRFATTLGFSVEEKTWEALCEAGKRLDEVDVTSHRLVPYETVASELLRSLDADPVKCLDIWEKSGVLFLLMPELIPLASCGQPKNFHSEGDVWTHTKLAVAALRSDGFKKFFPGERASVEVVLATLLHDVSKPETAQLRGDKLTFYGHPEQGSVKARAIAERLRLSSAGMDVDAERVEWLVHMHLLPGSIRLDQVKKTTLVRHFLSDELRGRELLHVAYGDAMGSVHEDGSRDLVALTALMIELGVLAKKIKPAQPLLSGKEIMAEFDIAAGPELGKLKTSLEEARLVGTVTTKDEARAFISSLLSSRAS